MKGDLDTEKVGIDAVRPHPKNVRQGDIGAICESLTAHGQYRAIVAQRSTGHILAGNHTWKAAKQLGWSHITTHYIDCDDDRAQRILLADNRANDLASYNDASLAVLLQELAATDDGLAGTLFDGDALDQLIGDIGNDIQQDEIPDNAPAITQLGDIWLLGDHRVMCGDSTDADSVRLLMNDKLAALMHADPPYGMGKEKDGVLNDNLYARKLDAFQMAWWKVCRAHLQDNASAYIWGNPEDLWRLWYVGGLRDSERLTFRNEIVWAKPNGQGQSDDGLRMFPIRTERCLFFMMGEQGFNVNADNYWEGWEPIRLYLETEMNKCGGTRNWKAALGNGMGSHYFSKSQWAFPTQEGYEKLQVFARGDAFKQDYHALKQDYDALKQDYDALKQDFYATRAHFNNTHDIMSEVWEYNSVTGAERYDHATPKPVEMIARIFKSSAPEHSITLEPFGGSGSTLIAAHQTGRTCYTMELDPHYCDIICARYQKQTGDKPRLEATGDEHNFLP